MSTDGPSTAPVAAIDCGTNSIRLLIARGAGDGGLVDVERRMEVVRLGFDVDRTGRFDPAAIERTLAATRDYASAVSAHGAERIRFVATSATRDASNREEFIDGVREILGVVPEVVPGDVEAELSFQGAVSTLDGLVPGPRLVVDIGGGSTELVAGIEAPEHRISLDMGSVRLTERHLRSDPPSEPEIDAARADIDSLLDQAEEVVPLPPTRTLVGVAGTVTTLTALAQGLEVYTPDATHGARLDIARMREVCLEVLAMSTDERRRRPIIHPGRIDVIGAGALIWERVLARVQEASGISEVRSSEHDILDGIALSLL
ncbi:Ppx/GppA family phosphatase [Brachybacterium halotolerans subsp. kimchii]|uniref:Ppx/GppA phosphatase family protein n=1 Tax=Brachybacterium halotolerans TaxID=2795215 RepID=UPI001E40B27B|nr:Ppx/GppA phosphatase family protein [Brachybacterium halotolerans]UEJ83422.1 Ppx/GppA family phosphatase [Brachybacterium halotolerans subsp. kimchii]